MFVYRELGIGDSPCRLGAAVFSFAFWLANSLETGTSIMLQGHDVSGAEARM